MRSAVVVTRYNRPDKIERSLPSICAAAVAVGAPILIVDDGSDESPDYSVHGYPLSILRLPSNRGLAGALNIGLAYWLADPTIEVIHYFQDDVEVDPLCIAACNLVMTTHTGKHSLVTGHHAAEHRFIQDDNQTDRYAHHYNLVEGIDVIGKFSCRATHMSATRESWMRVLPIPSRGLGLPGTRIMDGKRGTGSGVDWWVVRDSPNRLPVLCIPGLVRSFAHKAADSTWLNESIGGEEPPLHRNAIKGWLENGPGKRT